MKILNDTEFSALAEKHRTRTSVASKLDNLLHELIATKKIIKGNKVQIDCIDIVGEKQAHYYNASLMLKEKYSKVIGNVVFTMLPKAQFTSVAFIVL